MGSKAGYDSFKTISPRVFRESDPNLVVVASKSHNSPETEAFVAKYKTPRRVSKGNEPRAGEGAVHQHRAPFLFGWSTLSERRGQGAQLNNCLTSFSLGFPFVC